MRPFFPFYGSKWRLAKHYAPPTHRIVIEPFAGSAGYSTFYNVPRAVLIDVDPIIVSVWQFLIRATEREIAALPDLADPHETIDDHELMLEARWLIGFWLNRGSAQPKLRRTQYSSDETHFLGWGASAKARIISQLDSIRSWAAVECDYRVAPNVDATWFIDPPYIDRGRYYRFRVDDYSDVAAFARSRRGLVIVCEGEHADWLPFEPLGSFKTARAASRESVFYPQNATHAARQ